MKAGFVATLLVCILFTAKAQQNGMPSPFYRILYYTNPPFQGSDVYTLQNLIARSPFVNASSLLNPTASGIFDQNTLTAVENFQKGNNASLPPPSQKPPPAPGLGVFGPATAALLLQLHSCDWYSDNMTSAGSLGYKYKFHIQVFQNRSYETIANLLSANNTLMHQFRIRAHGWDNATANPPWPYWSNTDGLNQFSSNGNTPTGLAECDLNSPEGEPMEYGPWPINRIINGKAGNALWVMTPTNALRTGILLHTGIWWQAGWNKNMDMPNSEGCVHAHEEDIYQIWQILTKQLGVEVRQNPGGAQPYPYKPQGLMSIEQVGCQ